MTDEWWQYDQKLMLDEHIIKVYLMQCIRAHKLLYFYRKKNYNDNNMFDNLKEIKRFHIFFFFLFLRTRVITI